VKVGAVAVDDDERADLTQFARWRDDARRALDGHRRPPVDVCGTTQTSRC
jgi:hypothetical protein